MKKLKYFIITIVSCLIITSLFLTNVSAEDAQEQWTTAILNFENNSSVGELDYLEEAVPKMLITGLAQCEKIKLVERGKINEAITELKLSISDLVDPKTVKDLGRIIGADHILLGSILKVDRLIRFDCRLIKVETAEIVMAEKVEGIGEESVISMTDSLAEKIIKKLTGEDIQIASPPTGHIPAAPEDTTLAVEAYFSNQYVLAGEAQSIYLQVEMYAQEAENKERLPLNISLVIDKSGSMNSQNKMQFVKKAAKFVIDNLEKNDSLSVVVYDDVVNILIPAQRVVGKDSLKQAIDTIIPNGSTNLSGGMLEGLGQVQKNYKASKVNRVLLLSDGLANRGITDPNQLYSLVQDKSQNGIFISTFGVGHSFNEDLMLGLAEYGGGNYFYIDSPEKISAIFDKELKGLLAVVAQNLKINLNLQEGVKVENVFGYKYGQKDNSCNINLNDIFGGDQKTILIKLSLPSQQMGELELGELELVYDDVLSNKGRIVKKGKLSVQVTSDENLVAAGQNHSVLEKVGMFETAVAIQDAVKYVDEGKREKAEEELGRISADIERQVIKYQDVESKKQLLSVEKYLYQLKQKDMAVDEKQEMQKEMKFKLYEQMKSK